MGMTVQNLVDTACLLARVDGNKGGVVAELLVPRVNIWVAQRAAADPARRALITTKFTVDMINGVGQMPPDVLVKYLKFAAINDPADPTLSRKMRWIAHWSEFIRPLDQSLGYFTATDNGTSFVMTQPGTPYTPGSGPTGEIELSTPARPSIAGGVIVSPPEIDQELVLALTAALKGNWEAVITAEGPPK